MALDGFYTVGDGSPASPSPGRRAETASQTVERVAKHLEGDAWPRPFDFSRPGKDDERTIALEALPRLRQLSGRTTRLHVPVLWVDGPTDLAYTLEAMLHRARAKKVAPSIPRHSEWVKSDWAKGRWELARQRVDELPDEILTEGSKRAWNDSGGPRTATTLNEGSWQRYLTAKVSTGFSALPAPLRSALSDSATNFAAHVGKFPQFRERLNVLANVQGTLGNGDALFNIGQNTWRGGQLPEYKRVAEDQGAERADLVGAMSILLENLRRQSANRNRTQPGDLHGVFFYGQADRLSYLAFLHELIRDLGGAGSNWTEVDHEVTWNLATKVTAHVPLTTFDILVRGPSQADLSPRTPASLVELEQRPYVTWADGTTINLVDGVELSPTLIAKVKEDPAALLKVSNVEQRRALLRIVGAKTVVEAVHSKLVGEDDFGKLYRMPNGTQFVIVKNATPEPDGSVREYLLGARGSDHKTPRSAVASTWGLTEAQYWPTKET